MDSNDDNVRNNWELSDAATPTAPLIPYSSGHRRAVAVISLFGTGILLSVASFAADFHDYQLMDEIRRNQPVSDIELEINMIWRISLWFARVIWYLSTAVAFLMWIHRAHKNLPSLGATGLEFSPRGAVGWYFVPFLNLFKPYQVMREIYNASEPSASLEVGPDWRRRNAPAVVKIWWALFLFMNLIHNAVMRADRLADTPAFFQFVAAASMVASIISITAMLAAAWLVWSVDSRQERRSAILGLT